MRFIPSIRYGIQHIPGFCMFNCKYIYPSATGLLFIRWDSLERSQNFTTTFPKESAYPGIFAELHRDILSWRYKQRDFWEQYRTILHVWYSHSFSFLHFHLHWFHDIQRGYQSVASLNFLCSLSSQTSLSLSTILAFIRLDVTNDMFRHMLIFDDLLTRD